jgi:hypothetical protein
MDLDRPQLPQSEFSKAVQIGDDSAQFVSRREQQAPALTKLEAFQQEHGTATTDDTDNTDQEPEIF